MKKSKAGKKAAPAPGPSRKAITFPLNQAQQNLGPYEHALPPVPARVPAAVRGEQPNNDQGPSPENTLMELKDFEMAKNTVDNQKDRLSILEEDSTAMNVVEKPSGVSSMTFKKTLLKPMMRKTTVRNTPQRLMDAPLEPVQLNFNNLFGKFNVKDYYPVHQITSILKVDSTRYIKSLYLDGIDQLTDLFFRCLLNESESTDYSPVITDVSLQGCTGITDKGIDWMAKALGKTLHSICLTGCRITSQAVVYLYNNINKESQEDQMIRLEIAGTKVDFVPVQRHWFKMAKFLTYGCPLVLPVIGDVMELVKEGAQLPLQTYKAVIIRDDGVKMSVTEFVFTQTLNLQNVQPLTICPQWKHTNGSFYNFIESDEDISNLFISERALFIIPYNSDEDVTTAEEAIVRKIIHVLSRVPHAVVILLRIGKGNLKSNASDIPDRVKAALKKIREELETETKEILNNLASQTSFEKQQQSSNAFAMIDTIDNVHLIPVDLDTATKQVPLEFEKALDQFEEKINKFYPQYEQVVKAFFDLANKVDRKVGIENATSMAKVLTKTKLLHGNEDTYLRALNLMHLMGKILYFPDQGTDGKLVTDLQWFGKVLNVILTKPQETAKGRLMCVTPQTSLWSPKSLKDALKTMVQDADTLKEVTDLLGKEGMVYSRHFHFVCHHLPKHTHMPFEHYWKNQNSSKDSTAVYTYTFSHTIPACVLFKVFEYCVKLRPPAVVWRRGILIQEGGVDCLIRMAQDKKSIVVCGRTFPIPDISNNKQADVILDCLWSSVKQYKLIVDYCLFKVFKLYAKVSREVFNIHSSIDATNPVVKGTFPNVVPYHHVIHDTVDQQIKASCEWCGMLGDNIESLWRMHQELRPTFHCQHVNVIDDQNLNVYRLNGEADIISSACMTPYEFSHFDVILMESCDLLGIGIRSWHKNPGFEVFIVGWKVLISKNHGPHKVQFALPAVQRTQKGDTIRIALMEGTKPDEYVLAVLNNGILLFDMKVPRDDYVPLIKHSPQGSSSANMAECVVDMSLAPKWQTPYPTKGIKIKDLDLKKNEEEIVNRKVELLVNLPDGSPGVFPATISGLHADGNSTMVEVTVDMMVNSKPKSVGLDSLRPVGYTETCDKNVMDECRHLISMFTSISLS
ncbi:uncharacterized protein LOC135484570 [Lineus longissimus]|uniref:uncharacterized protein LOC135484570 n=1 Tax=Lineus longissimus TaxID=88925 RepID=UPI00315C5B79